MPHPTKLPSRGEIEENPIPVLEDDDRIIKYVTFFGDSQITEDHPEYKKVYELARRLAQRGYGVVNGGGPGVMKAATAGAESVDGHTIAIYWEPKLAAHFEGKNFTNITDESASYSNYMMRTLGLIEKAHVFIACLGGTGTVSEFGMVWALAKMYFGKHKPLILFGDFWHPIVDAFKQNMLIDDEEMDVLYYAHTAEQVCDLMDQFEAEVRGRSQVAYSGEEAAFVIDARRHKTRASYAKAARQYHIERAGELVSQKQLDEFMTLVDEGKVLDIGCGPGFDLGYLQTKYPSIKGLEISPQFCEIARQENPGVEIENGDMVYTDLGKDEYTGIWSRDAFHHVPGNEQELIFKKAARALKSEGILYLIVQKGEGEDVKHEKRSTYHLERFYHYYSEQELRERGEKAGLEVIKIEHNRRSHEWLIAVYRKP